MCLFVLYNLIINSISVDIILCVVLLIATLLIIVIINFQLFRIADILALSFNCLRNGYSSQIVKLVDPYKFKFSDR